MSMEYTGDLTSREREILEIYSRGFTRDEICKALKISSHTVAWHWVNIKRKLHAANPPEALATALRGGHID